MKHWILVRHYLPPPASHRRKTTVSCNRLRKNWMSGSITSRGNTAQSWCANEVALRIVANGNKNVKILDNFCHASAR